jgi:hypothetical protein
MLRSLSLPILFITSFLLSCAGPMTPFGAHNELNSKTAPVDDIINTSWIAKEDLPIQIDFSPKRQNLHSAQHLKVRLRDKTGISKDSRIRLYYGGIDVTDKMQVNAIDGGHEELEFHLKNFRLPADRDNQIVFTYQKNQDVPAVIQEFKTPYCSMVDSGPVLKLENFNVNNEVLSTINSVSVQNQVNPFLVAAMMAQESGFNPNAISWAKALGLMQITSIAEEEVIDQYAHWPRYPDIKNLNVAEIKLFMVLGEINEKTEWRLNSNKAVLGGIKYLQFLQNYWQREENRTLLNDTFSSVPTVDVLLASYNSGAARVKKTIIELGGDWKKAHKLKEARKYVSRVKSYCYHFSEEQNDES